jgi:hypothetical protein
VIQYGPSDLPNGSDQIAETVPPHLITTVRLRSNDPETSSPTEDQQRR